MYYYEQSQLLVMLTALMFLESQSIIHQTRFNVNITSQHDLNKSNNQLSNVKHIFVCFLTELAYLEKET